MRTLKILFSTIALLLLVAGIFLYLNFVDLAKNAAEKIASNALGVSVSISSLDISLKEKQATIKGIKIANPPGFKKSHIITANQIDIGLTTASRELIDFKDVQVNGTVVNLEVTPNGTNLNALKKLASRKKQKESVGSEPIRVIVRKMVINTSTLNPSVTLLNKDIGSIQLPPVRISGIGRNSNGAMAQDAVSQIIVQYIKAAESQAKKRGMFGNTDAVIQNFKDSVDNVEDSFKGLFK